MGYNKNNCLNNFHVVFAINETADKSIHSYKWITNTKSKYQNNQQQKQNETGVIKLTTVINNKRKFLYVDIKLLP